MKRIALFLVLGVCVALAAVAQPYHKTDGSGGLDMTVQNGPFSGQVRYDPGAPADSLLFGTTGTNQYAGNLFNSNNGNPLYTGSIYAMSWYVGALGTYTGSYNGNYDRLVLMQPGGGFLTYGWAGPLNSYTFNSASFSPYGVGTSFFAGKALGEQGSFSFGAVGVRSASVRGQGFHGINRTWGGASSNALPGQNVMFRVSGDILPVELMEFDVE